MQKHIPAFFCALFFCLILNCAQAGFTLRDFENPEESGESWNGVASREKDPVKPENATLKLQSDSQWAGVELKLVKHGSSLDFSKDVNDRLSFRIFAIPSNHERNTVGVRFFDEGLYAAGGFEVWTTRAAPVSEWSEHSIQFSELPPDFDWRQIKKIQFVHYWPGTYFLDDVRVLREERVYQSFEPEPQKDNVSDKDFGWVWNAEDSGSLSPKEEPVHAGKHSWKLVTQKPWGGTGLVCERRRFFKDPKEGPTQSPWHVDLFPQKNDRLVFWVYALPSASEDVAISVQFFDYEKHASDATRVSLWTEQKAKRGQWTRLQIVFKDLPKTLNLSDLNKIQFQVYWPGTYYFDDIAATGPIPRILFESKPRKGLWWQLPEPASPDAEIFSQIETAPNPGGPWEKVYRGNRTEFQPQNTFPVWYRLRFEYVEGSPDGIPCFSPWSDSLAWPPQTENAPAA